jgi:antirestriction protein ArdC
VCLRIARAECFFGATGATLADGGNRAFYRPSTDSIVLPLFEAFRDAESYYATLAHETTHWTAHESRLARDFGTKRLESEGYAIEELVAELGAAFLCAHFDQALEPREDHAAYMASRKINLSHVFAGQNVGVTQVGDHVWLVTFMHDDLGYFDDEVGRLEPIESPFGPKVLPMCSV